ncbi:GNAT family N-acetyltransferase [Nocardiopsis alkaliphila]|uniref:GNAT family N-acetyltransferase n=1 Tax=Nocardiopsis alkaliphila TaxID=225762 RepID=UPI00034A6C7A|nr:GNAT family N-acetyltransferase [Nocardiopsis alkaliphila]
MPANTPEQAETPALEHRSVPGLRLVRLDRNTPQVELLREVVSCHRVVPDQRRFVDEAVHTLPRADADPDRFPYAIVLNEGDLTDRARALDACAGFGIIDRVGHLRELVDAPETAVLLRAFYVTPEHQGRGIGRASCSAPLIDLLVAQVAPQAQHLILCLDDGNDQGERTYRAAGFTPTGRRHDAGERGWQSVFSRPLNTGSHPVPRLPEPR